MLAAMFIHFAWSLAAWIRSVHKFPKSLAINWRYISLGLPYSSYHYLCLSSADNPFPSFLTQIQRIPSVFSSFHITVIFSYWLASVLASWSYVVSMIYLAFSWGTTFLSLLSVSSFVEKWSSTLSHTSEWDEYNNASSLKAFYLSKLVSFFEILPLPYQFYF